METLKAEGRWRETQVLSGKDFCSNDYLGLSRHPALREKLVEYIRSCPSLSASASRLIPGHHREHEEAELFFARHFQSESGLIFNSGYAANVSLMRLFGRDHVIFSDELNHASLIDGIRASRARKHIFKHGDLDHLEVLLKSEGSEKKLIVTESVFSMDGDLAPLQELFELAKQYNCKVVVDEAHATGVFGESGCGLAAEYAPHCIRVFTFGKALAAHGAFVACTSDVREALVNSAREFIYSTALPPHVIYQARTALELISTRPELCEHLDENIKFLRNQLELEHQVTPIFPILMGSNHGVLEAQSACCAEGFEVSAIRYPTVAKGKERLRICVHADHENDDLENLARIIQRFR